MSVELFKGTFSKAAMSLGDRRVTLRSTELLLGSEESGCDPARNHRRAPGAC